MCYPLSPFFNGKMFTFYICHLIWALYNLQMPSVFNFKRLFQNTEKNLQLIPPNPMSTPLLQKELLQKEGVGEERFMRNTFWLLGLLREPLPGAAAPPCPRRQGQLTFDAGPRPHSHRAGQQQGKGEAIAGRIQARGKVQLSLEGPEQRARTPGGRCPRTLHARLSQPPPQPGPLHGGVYTFVPLKV